MTQSRTQGRIDSDGGWRLASGGFLNGTQLRDCTAGQLDAWLVSALHGPMYDVPRSGCWVKHPHGQSHALAYGHHMADAGLVGWLDAFLRPQKGRHFSVNDYGCGLGQLGHALLARDPQHRYWGCDAGDSMELSGGFVHSCKADQMPMADWVVSLEVGEHIPAAGEANYLHALDAAACRGIILSWAAPGQGGHGHVNTQAASSFVPKVEAMGYRVSTELTNAIRDNASLAWFSHRRDCRQVRPLHRRAYCVPEMGGQLVVFDRVVPRTHEGCSFAARFSRNSTAL